MITKTTHGTLGGRAVALYTLTEGDLSVSVSEYGATVTSVEYRGVPCALGYPTLDGYVHGGSCQGATVGRYANRIGGGRFTIGGVEYILDKNENGKTTLHGGGTGFGGRLLRGEEKDGGVRFSLVSADGESGFPGKMDFSVLFTVRDDTLRIEYGATADKTTVMNFTNHTYFTLGGRDCLDTALRIDADFFTPTDGDLIPTGEIAAVDGTPFDLREARRIGDGIASDHQQIVDEDGYDHNFVLRGEPRAFKRGAAEAYCPSTGIRLVCSTDMPGIQLYTANMLDEPPLFRHEAFCLETQFYPNSPNEPGFPSCVVGAGERFRSVTEFRFSRG